MSIHEANLRRKAIIEGLKRGPLNKRELAHFVQNYCASHDLHIILADRTLSRDRDAIYLELGILIEFNHSLGKYVITEQADPVAYDRFFEHLDLISLMKRGVEAHSYIFFNNRKPVGTELMKDILTAILDRKLLAFQYKKHWEDKNTEREVEPLALKEAQGRWYLLSKEKGQLKTFGLDRMKNLRISRTKNFTYPVDFHSRDYYKDCFGILNPAEVKPTKVVLKFESINGQYVIGYPLHSSQKLVKEEDNGYLFEYFIKHTYDFEQEILSHGEKVEVIEPLSLKNSILTRLSQAINQYAR